MIPKAIWLIILTKLWTDFITLFLGVVLFIITDLLAFLPLNILFEKD